MADCRYCGASIVWALNENSGKRMPFDESPYRELGAKGWSLARRRDAVVARYVRDAPADLNLRRPHFETCTQYQRGRHGVTSRSDVAAYSKLAGGGEG